MIVTHEFLESDRYHYDALLCKKGYATIDTEQDAPYYGNWANPVTRVLFSYAEGDCATTECDSDDEFIQAINDLCDWHCENSKFYGIDPGLKIANEEPWIALGLQHLLH
jgi:hypothetical protein